MEDIQFSKRNKQLKALGFIRSEMMGRYTLPSVATIHDTEVQNLTDEEWSNLIVKINLPIQNL